MDGVCVPCDYNMAVKWFKAAAEQGEPDSMFHLALCYNEGLGVKRNLNLVVEYLFDAADQGWQAAIDCIEKNNLQRPTYRIDDKNV